MPNIKSAKKRVIVSQKNAMRNKATKTNLKTTLKKATAAIEAGKPDEAVRLAIKKIDQAAAKGIMHKNTAARKKSALVKKANAAS
ncbi:MAG: 30S ribosomal protein S20 [Oscillospiraceae bacterium]|jgi:small subunit ribosomal protein S20|nr:30S ribosomal protein S20 [Oscillospiraceae bacterium]